MPSAIRSSPWIRLSRHLAATLLGVFAAALLYRGGAGPEDSPTLALFAEIEPVRSAFADLAHPRAGEKPPLWRAHRLDASSLKRFAAAEPVAGGAAPNLIEDALLGARDWRRGAQFAESEVASAAFAIKVRAGDSLQSALARAGLTPEEAKRAAIALAAEFPAKALKAGQRIELDLRRAPRLGAAQGGLTLEALSLARSPTREITLTRNVDGEFRVAAIEKPLILTQAHLSGTIRFSLYDAAVKAGLPHAMIADLIKAYSYDVDFQRDIQRGDSFDIVYERLATEDGIPVGAGRMLYASLSLSGEAMPIYYFERDGAGEYFKPNGEAVKKSLLQTPIDGARITSGFGPRLHPLLGYTKMHKGVDFGAPTGTPIFAAGTGKIVEMGVKSGYGNYIKIRHNDTYATAYAHCSRFAAGLKIGATVGQGDVIAYVGATGRVTGPHLHYEIFVAGQQVNPKSVKDTGINKLGGKELQKFKAVVAAIDKIRGGSRNDAIASDPAAGTPDCAGGCVN